MKLLLATIAFSLLDVGFSVSTDESWADHHFLYRRRVPEHEVDTSDNETTGPPHFDPGFFFMCPNDASIDAYDGGGVAPCLFDISSIGDDHNDEAEDGNDLAAANCELRFEEANGTHGAGLQKRARGGGRPGGKGGGGPLGLCLELLGGLGGGKSKGKGYKPKISTGGHASGRHTSGRHTSGGRQPQRPSHGGSKHQGPPPKGSAPRRHHDSGHSRDYERSQSLKKGAPIPAESSRVRDRYDTRKPVQSQNGVSVYPPRNGKGPYRAEVDVDPRRYPGNAHAMGRQSRAYPQTVARDQFPGKGFPRTGGQGYFDPRSGRVVYGNGQPAPVTKYHPSQVPPEIRAQAARNGNMDGVYSPPPPKKGAGDYAKQGGQWALKGGQWVLHNAWNLNMLQGMGKDIYYAVKPKTMNGEAAQEYDDGYNDVPEDDPYYDNRGYQQDDWEDEPYDDYYDPPLQGGGQAAPPRYPGEYYPPGYEYPPGEDYPSEEDYSSDDDYSDDDDDDDPNNHYPASPPRRYPDTRENGVPHGW